MICRFLLAIWITVCTVQATAQFIPGKEVPRPKLVVGIVVDQMRWDYLYRFYNRYTEDGFKRLLREGFTCENTYINYLPTVTAIGHSSVYTGSVPAIHGIAGNSFIMQESGKTMYCTEDNSVETVGAPGKAGQMSPKNLLSSTITDELKLATNFQAKVIGVALKDRGSILPAGHFANAAYWLDEKTGNWITSTYYMKQLPGWVEQFNEKKLAEKYLKNDWHTLYPLSTYRQSLPDNNNYEGAFTGSTVSFPIQTSSLISTLGPGLVKTTPFGNTLTMEMAKAAIKNEKLGMNPAGVTDFLAVSFSSIDAIGHQFAVNSPKVEDALLRLDQDLGDFLKYLDQNIGKGRYTVFLTADHGAAHNPQFYLDEKGNGGYFKSDSVKSVLNQVLQKQFNEHNLVISLSNYQVHLNNRLIKEKGLDEQAIRKIIVQSLKGVDGIAFVTDMETAADAAIPGLIRERVVNGYNHKRSGIIQFILEPQIFAGRPGATGTSHGNWNPYDSRIPLIWMGWGIKTGSSARSYNMTDIAPTIAALLRIQEPNGNIGQPITEILKN
jgi:predicted AlkP superfamily pyrophosphatase or phosphodiesterase